jgi:cell division protein FtsB
MDKDILKSLLYEYWHYLVIAVLCFLLLKSCTGGKELRLANDELKTEVKELILSSDKYVAKNNELSSKIVQLEKLKAKVKTEIVYIENKTKSDLKKVPTLNTKQIANYYQERYKLPVTLTQYGVSLSDTIAKKNITELIEKDGCFAEVKLFKVQLTLEEKKGVLKDTIIGNFKRANVDLNKAIFAQKKIIINTENSLKKEKNKKTFWQVTSGAILIGAGYLLIK